MGSHAPDEATSSADGGPDLLRRKEAKVRNELAQAPRRRQVTIFDAVRNGRSVSVRRVGNLDAANAVAGKNEDGCGEA